MIRSVKHYDYSFRELTVEKKGIMNPYKYI